MRIQDWFPELQKSIDQSFLVPPLRNSRTRNPLMHSEFQSQQPPMHSEFLTKEPPMHSEFQNATHGMGTDIFWNYSMSHQCHPPCHTSVILPVTLYSVTLPHCLTNVNPLTILSTTQMNLFFAIRGTRSTPWLMRRL